MFFTRKVPRYWIENKTMVGTTIFTILFSILFLLIYDPFSSTSWLSLVKAHQPNYYRIALASVSFYLVAIAIFVLSKFFMSSVQHKRPLHFGTLLIWGFAEAGALSITYTLFTELFIIPNPQLFLAILGKSFVVLLFILFIPYIISILLAITIHQRKLLNRLAEKRSSEKMSNSSTKLIPFIDNTGKIKISISIDAIYHIESQDNYVKVYYESEGKICTYMLRSTTKAIEDQFKDYFVRCHRSYIVNKHKITLFNGDRGNMYLKLSHESIQPIPVSRTYTSNIQEILTPVHS